MSKDSHWLKKLTRDWNTNASYSKGLRRLFFMWKLRQFGVHKHIVPLFYHSFVESIFKFFITAWYFSLLVSKIVDMSSKIVGHKQSRMTELCESRVAGKGRAIIAVSHPPYSEYELLSSGRRHRVPSLRTYCVQGSFINSSVAPLNKWWWYKIRWLLASCFKAVWFESGVFLYFVLSFIIGPFECW